MGCIEVVGTAEAKSEGLGVGSRVVGEIVGEAEGESSVGFALLVGLPVGGGVDTVGYAVGEPGSTGAREGGIVVSCVGRVSKPSEGSLLAAAEDVEEESAESSGSTLSAIGIATPTMASKAITESTMAHFNRRRVRSAFTSSCFSKSGCVSALLDILQDYTQ